MSMLAPPRPPTYTPPPTPPWAPAEPKWRARLPWRSPEAKAAPRDDLATLCIFGVTLAVALSLGRLFRDSTWLGYGVAAAVLGHLLAWGLRRLGAGLTVVSVASPLTSMLVAIELVVPQATTYGFPTPFTFRVLGQGLSDAQGAFRTAVPPVAPVSGYLAASVVAVCMTAFLADWAAFRMRTAFEATAPGLALFVFASVLGAKSHRGLAVAGFAAAALVFLIVQRANLDGTQTAWFGGRHRGALSSLLATGAVLGSVAVIGGLVLGPRMPGANSKPLVSLKKSGGGAGRSTRSTVSPLVDIQSRLREYQDVQVFTVKATTPAYWRLTSLDQFDGTIWSSSERYVESRGELSAATTGGSPLVQEVKVTGLSSIWLPAAYRPTKLSPIAGLKYSSGSASLISKKETTNNLTYTVTSDVPDPTPLALRQAPPSDPGQSGLGGDLGRYLKVGGTVADRVRQLAAKLEARQATPFAKARALQDFFRSGQFAYSLAVDPGHSSNALDRFLFVTKTGYCEQFAGSYALLARLMGLPSRVAVGFQPGTVTDGTFVVKDKDAHAWPEVYLEGIGWTAFEPTPGPGGGNPQASSYTGVPYTPPAPTGPSPTTPAGENPTRTPTSGPTSPTSSPSTPTPTTQPPKVTPTPHPHAQWWSGLTAALRRAAPFLAALGLVAALLGGSAWFVAWERRRYRQRRGGSADARVHVAWEESVQALALTGIRPRPTETVAELLCRLGSSTASAEPNGVEDGTEANASLRRLGAAVVETAYTGRTIPTDLADRAEADRTTIVQACRATLNLKTRLLHDLDPRPALARHRSFHSRTPPPEMPVTTSVDGGGWAG